ncbi:MAG: hypothetical protein OJF60_003251 [Burkholderiaceae bacterium]|jgi:hypothetical protein|nr:MAG: hypothetical protein OJF60_003251 [Burkholderiaceae bacterium]
MHARIRRIAPVVTISTVLAAALLAGTAAHAQLGDLLKQGGGGSSGNGLSLGNLGGALSGQSMTSSSMGNVAGLLEFCIKNNYLSGGAASPVQSALMGKLPGGASSTDSGYSSGLRGILSGSNGSQLDLGGGGLKEQLTKQVCDKVLDQGKSMIGGGLPGLVPSH